MGCVIASAKLACANDPDQELAGVKVVPAATRHEIELECGRRHQEGARPPVGPRASQFWQITCPQQRRVTLANEAVRVALWPTEPKLRHAKPPQDPKGTFRRFFDF